eukprot:3243859-Rhodomonas_salina.2
MATRETLSAARAPACSSACAVKRCGKKHGCRRAPPRRVLWKASGPRGRKTPSTPTSDSSRAHSACELEVEVEKIDSDAPRQCLDPRLLEVVAEEESGAFDLLLAHAALLHPAPIMPSHPAAAGPTDWQARGPGSDNLKGSHTISAALDSAGA